MTFHIILQNILTLNLEVYFRRVQRLASPLYQRKEYIAAIISVVTRKDVRDTNSAQQTDSGNTHFRQLSETAVAAVI